MTRDRLTKAFVALLVAGNLLLAGLPSASAEQSEAWGFCRSEPGPVPTRCWCMEVIPGECDSDEACIDKYPSTCGEE